MALCNHKQAGLLDADDDQVIQVETDNLGGWKRNLWEKRNLPDLVRHHRFDTVFVPYQVAPGRLPARTVLMLRNMEPFCHRSYRYPLSMRLRNIALQRASEKSMRQADHVIAVSDYARSWLVDRMKIPEEQTTRIYHGRNPWFAESVPDDVRKTILAEMSVTGPFLLTCGSLLPYRRTEDVIQAFARWQTGRDNRATLVIAGDGNDTGYRSHLEQLAAAPQLAGRVRFTGHVTAERMRVLYQAAEVVILATEIEACPNIAIEAMSAGCAILAGNSDPLPEIIGRDNARFFERRNLADLAGGMEELMTADDTADDLRQRVRDRAAGFSWDRCVADTVQLLGRV